jgi:hypothetical protein
MTFVVRFYCEHLLHSIQPFDTITCYKKRRTFHTRSLFDLQAIGRSNVGAGKVFMDRN